MITLLKFYTANLAGKNNIIRSRAVMKLAGLSTDEKPLIKFKDIEIENGSSFIEIDTSKIYKYDEENGEWIEQVKGSNKDIIIENNALLTYINEVTGSEDTTLSDAVFTLANGYGGYSIDDIASGNEPSGDLTINSLSIAQYAFYRNSKIISVVANNARNIGQYAFSYCSNLKSFSGENVTTLTTQQNFANCGKLENLYLPLVTSIPPNCFNSCSSLINVNLPKATTLAQNAFKDCTSLKTIYLASCAGLSAATIFDGCTALTDIYLPKSASTYYKAPWGATNATIHYNTQFDENGEPIL